MNRYVYNVFTCSETCPILFLCYSIKIFITDFQSLTYFLVKKFKIYLYIQKKDYLCFVNVTGKKFFGISVSYFYLYTGSVYK